jgi:predicted amidohydrolase
VSGQLRVAAVQLTATADKAANHARAAALVEEAAAQGAELVVVPELFSCTGTRDELLDGAEPLHGPTLLWAAEQAERHDLWLLAGSFAERRDGDRVANTSCLVAPDGHVAATYRKVHLFDNDVPGASLRESATFEAGDHLVVAHDAPVPIGMATCYDLRFPEQFRALTLHGARVVVLPAAFTATTGPPHWEVLLRARAIENQVFVVAADQVGASSAALHWHGHSMIVDPWGEVLGERVDPSPGVVVADLDFARQDAVRAQLPSLQHRRPDVYDAG